MLFWLPNEGQKRQLMRGNMVNSELGKKRPLSFLNEE